jgi:hypothetical protein
MLVLRVNAALWERITAAVEFHSFRSRGRRDLTALRAALRIVRTAEQERRAKGHRMAVLRLPGDARQLYWLEQVVRRCVSKQVRLAATRLLRRIEKYPALPPLVQALHQQYSQTSSALEKRQLELRLRNLGYKVCPGARRPWRDPEGCLEELELRTRWADEDGLLTGHLKTLLNSERKFGLL